MLKSTKIYNAGYRDAAEDHEGGFDLSNVLDAEIDAALYNYFGDRPHPSYAAGYKAFVQWLRSRPTPLALALSIYKDEHRLSDEYDVQEVFEGQPAKDKWKFCYGVAREALNNGIV